LLTPALAERLLHAVDDGFDEQLRVSADRVRCPSVRGAEASAGPPAAEPPAVPISTVGSIMR
jgi:hypothetical protein